MRCNRTRSGGLWLAQSFTDRACRRSSLAGIGGPLNDELLEDPFKLLVQSIVDYAIYLLDLNGKVTSWNAGAERIKGFQAEEIVGQHFSRFYTDEDREAGVPARVLETA